MKKLLCCLLILFFYSINYAQQQLSIIGKGFPAQQEIILSQFDAKSRSYIEISKTTTQIDQSFQFVKKYSEANLYQLSWNDGQKVLLSVEQAGEIILEREDSKIEIKGSDNSQKMQTFAQKIQALQGHYFGSLKAQLDQAMANGEKEKAESLMKKANDLIPQFVQELRSKINAFGISPAGYFALQFSDFNKEQAYTRDRLALFEKEMPNSPVTQALQQQVEQASATALGKTPPPIHLEDKNGNKVSLEQFSGKILLVDFWASWCRACRVENPKFVSIYQEYKAKGFEILSISSDENTQAWQAAINKDGIAMWQQLQDAEEKVFELYGVNSLPQNIVIGRQGKIIAKNLNAQQLEELLAKKMQ